jgi:hypothetical protein
MQLADLQQWIRRDPAGRGLFIAAEHEEPACVDDLRQAAAELSREAECVALVTGFFVPDGPLPAAETDGPLGTILLADVLQSTGRDVCLISDTLCEPALRVGLAACGVKLELLACPIAREESRQWREAFWAGPRGRRLTHLVSVERIGPAFAERPEDAQCRNMRHLPIDRWSADLYRLFEQRPASVRTIGIGDGGNEIGMGRFWEEVRGTRPVPPHACRTATDWTVLAGVSDWGAMALAAAFLMHEQKLAPLKPWTAARIQYALTEMVLHGPAVDGCTRCQEPSVDGLPFATYIQPWELIRRELDLAG